MPEPKQSITIETSKTSRIHRQKSVRDLHAAAPRLAAESSDASFVRRRTSAAAIVIAIITCFVSCSPQPAVPHRYTIALVTNNRNGFKDRMTQLGYVEGNNVTYLFEGVPVRGQRLEAVLTRLVATQVDLIFTAGTPTGVAAHRHTQASSIPVIFGVIADPIAAGVLSNLTRPGGNMTGVRLSQNQARRLELLLNMIPNIHRVFVPYNPEDAASSSAVAQVQKLAPSLGVTIVKGLARNDHQVNALLASIPANIDAIFLVPGTTVNARLKDLLAVAVARRLPVSGPSTVQVEEGALTAYGFVHRQVGAQAARLADQVLKGANPGHLPVETAESFLAVNLQTAKRIGHEVPYDMLQKAEVIVRADH